MAVEILYHPAVQLETDEIVGYYEAQKKGLGLLFLEVFDLLLQRMQQSPLQFPVIRKSIRKATVRDFPYNVYFRLYKNQIVVLAILHQKRNPKIWKRRKQHFI